MVFLGRLKGSQRRSSPRHSNKTNRDQVCHKCRSPNNFINFFPQGEVKYKKNHLEKGKHTRNDQCVSTNRRMTTQDVDKAVKRTFAKMGKTSSEDTMCHYKQEDDHQRCRQSHQESICKNGKNIKRTHR